MQRYRIIRYYYVSIASKHLRFINKTTLIQTLFHIAHVALAGTLAQRTTITWSIPMGKIIVKCLSVKLLVFPLQTLSSRAAVGCCYAAKNCLILLAVVLIAKLPLFFLGTETRHSM